MIPEMCKFRVNVSYCRSLRNTLKFRIYFSADVCNQMTVFSDWVFKQILTPPQDVNFHKSFLSEHLPSVQVIGSSYAVKELFNTSKYLYIKRLQTLNVKFISYWNKHFYCFILSCSTGNFVTSEKVVLLYPLYVLLYVTIVYKSQYYFCLSIDQVSMVFLLLLFSRPPSIFNVS